MGKALDDYKTIVNHMLITWRFRTSLIIRQAFLELSVPPPRQAYLVRRLAPLIIQRQAVVQSRQIILSVIVTTATDQALIII